MADVYVSITGFRPNGLIHLPRFWWHTVRSLAQARRAEGNLGVAARFVAGTYHTMTIWRDESSMRGYVVSGAHRRAMKNFRTMGAGRTYGYRCAVAPDWHEAYHAWTLHSREV